MSVVALGVSRRGTNAAMQLTAGMNLKRGLASVSSPSSQRPDGAPQATHRTQVKDVRMRPVDCQDPWSTVVAELSASPSQHRSADRFNPRPAGEMRPGSASEAVIEYLRQRPSPIWSTHRQIVLATGRSGKSVDWALIYLRGLGLIEHAPHPESETHRRYRAAVADRGANVGGPHLSRTSTIANDDVVARNPPGNLRVNSGSTQPAIRTP